MTMNFTTRFGILVAATLLPALAWGCTLSSTGIAFGGYNPLDTISTDSTAIVSVECETAYSISLSEGLAGTFHPRTMAGSIDSLQYNLFTGPDYSVIWGNGISGSQVVTGPGGLQPVEHVIYGRIFAQQNVRIGSYADTITVTLEF